MVWQELRSITGAAVTAASPITPVIPSPGRVADALRAGPAVVRPLPMAGPAAALAVPAGVVYGTGRIDASGRVTDHAVGCALGWREGDRLTLTASPGVVTTRRDPGGMVIVPARACLAVPAVLRRRCGLRAGDRVLLAAVPGAGMLAVYSFAVVDRALRACGAFPCAIGGQP